MNIGLTCYMNAALQCFFHFRSVTKEFLRTSIKGEYRLSKAYSMIISYLLGYDNSLSGLTYFKELISTNPLFRNYSESDSKDLTIHLVQTLHREMNTRKHVKYPVDYNANLSDKLLTINNSIKKFQEENNSIIYALLYSSELTEYTCQKCGNKTFNLGAFTMLEVSLKKLSNFVKELNLPQLNLRYFMPMKEEKTITDENNRMYCSRCNKEQRTEIYNQIYSLSKCLIISLNYGRDIEQRYHVVIDEFLDFSAYSDERNINKIFRLIGAVVHLGFSGRSGHYVAYCRHFDGRWYCFNDDQVNLSSFDDINSRNQYRIPYVLFYESVN